MKYLKEENKNFQNSDASTPKDESFDLMIEDRQN